MKDQIQKAKSELLEALRRAKRVEASKRTIRKLGKIIGELEALQHTI